MSEVSDVLALANRALDATEKAAKHEASAEWWKRWGDKLQADVLAFIEERMIRGNDLEDPLYALGEELTELVGER